MKRNYLPGPARMTRIMMGACLAATFAACGDSSTDPDIITENKLKSPSSLFIVDHGAGSITLYWNGNNYESKFDGYNVYGAKHETIANNIDGTTIKKSSVLQLLDSDGEVVTAAKDLLGAMSYNTDTPYEAAGTASTDEAKEFSAIPIQKTAGAFPSCRPSGEGSSECVALEATEETHVERGFGGMTHYKIDGLDVGTEYCFMVLSSMDGGTNVSAVSTELKCVIPKHKGAVELTDVGTAKSYMMNFSTWRSSCTSETCTPAAADITVSASQCGTGTETSFCIENFGTDPKRTYFTPGKGSAIKRVGLFTDGFAEKTLLGTSAVSSFKTTKVDEGYVAPGQSLPVQAGYVYAIATASDISLDTPTSFFYDFVHVSSIDHDTGAITINYLLSNAVDTPSTEVN
ncbi:MAG: hypothetical protein HRU09_04720 [Oligoflexales bacterium]|nr:hypothetical protein [Oligoflexales bacterium]